MATNERRPLPAGWGWTDDEEVQALLHDTDADPGAAIAVADIAGRWTVYVRGSTRFLARGTAVPSGDIVSAKQDAEAECWARGLFGIDAAPAAQPAPSEPPWRWGAMRFTSSGESVGRFYEEQWCGTWRIVCEGLNEDGTFDRRCYALAQFEFETPMIEDAVRAFVIGERSAGPCDDFTEPSARPGRCRCCGHDKAAHEAKRAGVPWEPGEVQVAGD